MINKKETVAMLLAGGQGSRLYALTDKIAKPAVPFGAKYRLIDFPLSNCVNSNIDTIGVLTQYQPLLLNEYIGNGQPWDLDRIFGGIHILPPYQAKKRTEWYKGTANAIFQNLHFVKRYSPDYVIILSGDHIYKMDYAKMIEFHQKRQAAATIAVIEVSLSEASRFGIMNTDADNKIIEFEEKPKVPKNNQASMGIYVFNADILYQYLEADDKDPLSGNDFGKNIIPKMLEDGLPIYACPFKGYWKDVGTIDSLWAANMDLLGEFPKFNLSDPDWRIYSRNDAYPPQYINHQAIVHNSLITEGSQIDGTVINSVLGNHVQVKKGAVIKDSVIFSNAIIDCDAKVYYSIIDEGAHIGKKVIIGKENEQKITVISSGLKISEGVEIAGGEIIESDVR
ncbi:MAG: glucose-1-phosphate adenylyltransferase [Bacilli bacterium]|nr:glucose-1-phosphate adenylyltransferase [Bacilli bacterium]